MQTPDPEDAARERALSQRLWAEMQARNQAEDEARRAHLEALRAGLVAQIDAASAALADLNRRALRDVLRGALAAHASVGRIAINQYTEFNDDTYVFDVDGFWLDDAYVTLDLGYASVYDSVEGQEPTLGRLGPRGFFFGMGLEQYTFWDEARAAFPPDTPTTRPDVLALRDALERRAYGPLYDVAKDVAARLRTLAPFGRHFWADGFGYAATIEATREELRISGAYVSQEHGPIEDRAAYLAERARNAGIPLGAVTSAYAADPERGPHVAVRLARQSDLERVEREITTLDLRIAARTLALPHPLGTFALAMEWGRVQALGIGPFDVPVEEKGWDGRWALDENALGALLGTARANAYGYEAVFTAEAAEALRGWAAAVASAEARFGQVRFSGGGRSGNFTYPV